MNNSCGYTSVCFQVSAVSSKPPAKGNIMNNFFGKAAMSKCFITCISFQKPLWSGTSPL